MLSRANFAETLKVDDVSSFPSIGGSYLSVSSTYSPTLLVRIR